MRFSEYLTENKKEKIIDRAKWLSNKLITADEEQKYRIIAILAVLSIEDSNFADSNIQNIINLAKRLN